jgi:ATP-dependent Clp protease protease subunit
MTHHKPYFKAVIKNDQTQTNTLEMLVYTPIGETYDGSGVTALDIKDQIDRANGLGKKIGNIVVRINSPGGDAFEGITIYNLLRAQNVPIQVFVDGIAASAASIVACAGDEIVMSSGNSMQMIHNAMGFGAGNATDLRKLADVLDKVSVSIGQTYVGKTGKTAEEISTMMNAETWMTADECVSNGFATRIEQNDRSVQALALARTFNMKNFKSIPDQLKNEMLDPQCACQCEECMAGNCKECSMENCVDENCTDCPMQTNEALTDSTVHDSSNLSLYAARVKLLTLHK